MSRALLKAQLEMVEQIAPAGKGSTAPAAPSGSRRKHKRQRDKASQPAKKISRATKRASMHPLDRLRKELEVKDHTRDNVAALNRRGDARHRATADRQARKLAAMLKPKKRKQQQAADDDSSDDETSVDMWKVLRSMKARGM